ncbi:rCG63439 [Rattus norvegicus]|uniref:RCG63439 n=1 Tax=Rattus norvegicus TaxID=10116 RepID=A6HBJ0_RAT|nr:rCG63439 [Rattus norvegicus]
MGYVCACAYTGKGRRVHVCQRPTQGVHPQFPPCKRQGFLFAAAYPRQADLQASVDPSVFPSAS